MDEQSSEYPKGDGTGDSGTSLDPISTGGPEEQDRANGGSESQYAAQYERHDPKKRRWRKTKYFFTRLLRVSPDRAIELGIGIVVLIFTGSQLYITVENNKGSTEQTNQLIAAAKFSGYAADQNVQASRNFAESARGINQGVNDAVGRLQAQANATEFARETSEELSQRTLEATVRNFNRAQRPWITIESIDPRDVQKNSLYRGYHGIGVISAAKVRMRNTGLSPAIGVVLDAKGVNFDLENRWAESAVQDFCRSLTEYKIQGFSIFPGESPVRDVDAIIPDGRTENGRFGIFLPGIIACVAYRSTVDSDWHYTGRVYKLDKLPLIGSMYGVFNKSALPLAANELVIEAVPYPDAIN